MAKSQEPIDPLESIRQRLGHLTMKWEPRLWLDTGIPDLNQVIGHRDLGVPYGRVIEIHGLESHGKSSIAMSLAGLAQRNGAFVIWCALEDGEVDPSWAKIRGLDLENNFALVKPYVGYFGVAPSKMKELTASKKIPATMKARLSTAQELCAEAEAIADYAHKSHDRIIIVIDSIASLLTEGEAEAGLEGANLRTNMDHPMFLGRLLRRWVGLAQSYNAMIIMTNQLRQSPKNKYQPWYTPGGNAPRFYSQVRVRVMRVKGSKIKDGGEQIGIQGKMTAVKNKVGGLEGSAVGFRIMYKGPIEFVPVKDLGVEDTEAGDEEE